MTHSTFTRRGRQILGVGVFLVLGASSCGAEDDGHEHGADHAGDHAFPANRLQHETSPYLLLHAHNPVDWYPWGPEAFARARAEDKPIFLSIGYSTCYWCHVMERNVFSDPEIAATMNEWYVNIKVDREERPDLDQIYMTATNLINRHGGWPNSIFLTPDLKPFFAGTYFPPEDMQGRPGFPKILDGLHGYWVEQREEVERVAEEITAAIRQLEAEQQEPPADPDSALVMRTGAEIVARFDAINGGFGGAPKFPPPMRLEFLLDAWETRRDERALEIVEHTLEAMASGGIYDHVGGGFHRYSTDARWHVPHFEKMLYNQAHLVRVYARAYALTGDERWRFVVEDILRYIDREMTSPDGGGFYSALDAETETVEGKYYVWTQEEIHAVLGDDDTEMFFALYDLAPMSEGEGGVVYRRTPVAEAARQLGVDTGQLQADVEKLRARLLEERAKRTYPLLDDKVVTAWNGMMIAACAEASVHLDNAAYLRAAARAAHFILERMSSDGDGLRRVLRGDGEAKYDGYLEDYAYFADGLMALYGASGDEQWLQAARRTAAGMDRRFWDGEGGGGFFFSAGGRDLIVRSKNAQDSALPAANAVAVSALMALARATGERTYAERAGTALRAFGGMMQQRPAAFTSMMSAARRFMATDWQTVGAAGTRRPGDDGNEAGRETGMTGSGGLRASEEGGASPVTLPELAGAAPAPALGDILRASVSVSDSTPAPGGSVTIEMKLSLQDGWHVNANPAASEWLIPTSLTLNSDFPLSEAKVEYPPGEPLFVSALEETLSVYSGEVSLLAEVTLGNDVRPGQAGDVRVVLQYQACDDVRCLAPVELVRSVALVPAP